MTDGPNRLVRTAVQKCRSVSQVSREGSPVIEKTPQSVANLGYHAHIYYDPTATRAVAERVCGALSEKFPVEIEEFRDTPRGRIRSAMRSSFSNQTSSSMSCPI